jgi:hypothetical protein
MAVKALPYSGHCIFYWFPIYVVAVLPFSLFVLLPAAVVFKLGEAVLKKLTGKKKERRENEEPLVVDEVIDASKIKAPRYVGCAVLPWLVSPCIALYRLASPCIALRRLP